MAKAGKDLPQIRCKETELKLLNLSQFVHLYGDILSVNLVGFLTENLWESVPCPIKSETLGLSFDDLCLLPASETSIYQGEPSQTKDENQHQHESSSTTQPSNLGEFIREVHKNRLENMQVLTPLEDVCCGVFNVSEDQMKDSARFAKMSTFMSEKKSHEVDIMASIIATITNDAGIQQIVDIGSGKGYLGQHLALKHNFNVLGIDSSQVNSHGAKVRGQKMKRQLPGNKKKQGQDRDDVKKESLFTNESYCKTCHSSKVNESESSDTRNKRKSLNTETFSKMSLAASNAEYGVTDNLDLNLDVSKDRNTESKEMCHECSLKRKQNDLRTSKTDGTSLYKPVTAFVDVHTNLSELLCDGHALKAVLLSGLHTCGDLSSTMLRLFSSNPTIHIVCNVPCCYHILTEEFDQSDVADQEFDQSGVAADQEACDKKKSCSDCYGFPMSRCLRSQKTRIGDVARMAACMAAERLAYEKKLSTEKLFYRAVLQVILKENYTIPNRTQRTGKLASKCRSFVDYTRRALKKMDYDENKLSDEAIQQYYDTNKPEMKKLEAFHQLRATLAPSIEALILLDKLCYLQEQEYVKEAYLVRLFHPVTSPRCHAIIATKS